MAVERHLAQLHTVRVCSGGATIETVAFKYRSLRPNALLNGTSSLSSGMENCACRAVSLMPTEAVPRDFRLAAISALMSAAVNSTSLCLVSARCFLHRVHAFANLGAFFARWGETCVTKRGCARFSRRSSFRDRSGFIRKIDVT